MNLQLWLVLAVVAAASCYLSWLGWRALRKAGKGCSTGCGCHGTAKPRVPESQTLVLISRDSIKLRNKT